MPLDFLGCDKYDMESFLSVAITRQNLYLRMKRYSLLYAAFAALLRSGWEDASQSIANLQQLNNTHFPPTVSEDTTFTHLYHLLLAVQRHYTARLDAAVEYYRLIPPQAGETYFLALLNQSIILRLGTPEEHKQAIKFLDEVERRLVTGGQSSPQIRAAWFLVRGITSTEVLRSQFASSKSLLISRELLNRVIRYGTEYLNTQLHTLSFSAMTARYKINTSIHEAEKCGLMAYIGARKSNNELWGLISGNLLAGSFL
jgi:hypothetical protein